ncbi:MAG: hypothetical protein NXI24_11650 [bacterium]|nr:hypothetical protein [bacterium]
MRSRFLFFGRTLPLPFTLPAWPVYSGYAQTLSPDDDRESYSLTRAAYYSVDPSLDRMPLVTTASVAGRRGFAPAFYSMPGFVFLQGGIAVYFLSSSGLVSEFVFFMLSVFSRIRCITDPHPDSGAANKKQTGDTPSRYRREAEA